MADSSRKAGPEPRCARCRAATAAGGIANQGIFPGKVCQLRTEAGHPGEKNNLVKKKQDVVERMRYALARKFWDNQEWLGGPQVKKTGRFTPLDYF